MWPILKSELAYFRLGLIVMATLNTQSSCALTFQLSGSSYQRGVRGAATFLCSWRALIERGHTDVYAYEAGWPAWKELGEPAATGDE